MDDEQVQILIRTFAQLDAELARLRDENAKLRARLDEQYARSFEIRERFGDG